MQHTSAAVDLAISVFEVAISDRPGHVAESHRLRRARFAVFFASGKPATIVMEACGSAHHWGRHLESQGHHVVHLPPHAVRPYVPRNKTDRADAKAILAAFRNEGIGPVPVKSVTQQVLKALRAVTISAESARVMEYRRASGVR